MLLTIKESKKNEGISKKLVKIKDIIFASTGVIGEEFPTVEKIKYTAFKILVDKLRENQNKLIWVKSASAIMTTDTKPKVSL